jgi:surface antigen
MVIGGVLGGVPGRRFGADRRRDASIIAGALAGAAIGGAIGRSMDEIDRMKNAQVLETVRTGVPSMWVNPDTGHQYSVTPTRTCATASDPCREYTLDANLGGQRETVYGTACRQPGGSWQIAG